MTVQSYQSLFTAGQGHCHSQLESARGIPACGQGHSYSRAYGRLQRAGGQ